MNARIVRLTGLLVTVIAFFLPATRSPSTGPGSGPYDGWVCAVSAMAATGALFRGGDFSDGNDVVGSICLMLSGWVNPLVVMYLLALFGQRFEIARRVLAVAIVGCLVATWIFLAKAPMVPLVGHYLWVGGILLILSPEISRLFKSPATAQP